MTCQFCGQPATVTLTNIVKGGKQVMHLCDGCAKKHDLLPDGPGPQLNLQALVALLAGQPAAPPETGSLTCPVCHLKYAVFRADGRLGCPADYEAFRPALEPLLVRIHRHTRHAGKTPKRAGRDAAGTVLKAQLAAAVAAENYEEAAKLRDRIRQKDGADEPG